MFPVIYIEKEVERHPRTLAILEKYPSSKQVVCERYTEVFNRKAQNFRQQKRHPSLILASKFNNHVLPTPEGYGIGTRHNYYFSHMYNCVYDCRYCFLQGMYRSAHYVLFVNFETFKESISSTLTAHPDEDVTFFSGYDCDSLAMDPLTGFIETFVPFFREHPRAILELRTKSTQVRTLLDHRPMSNCVVAMSLNPPEVQRAVDHRTPSIEKRIDTLEHLQRQGWTIGLRFDPLLYHENWKNHYRKFFKEVFSRLDSRKMHSLSLGGFRTPKGIFNQMKKLYPRERLFHSPFHEEKGLVSYLPELENEMTHFCTEELKKYAQEAILFPCCS